MSTCSQIVDRRTPACAGRYPHCTWRDLCLAGSVTHSLADHVLVAWGRGEDIQTPGSGGEVSGLLRRFAELRRKAAARTGRDFRIIVIQEAGLDGFWIHRVLRSEGIESHVVDAASILTSRRRRRAIRSATFRSAAIQPSAVADGAVIWSVRARRRSWVKVRWPGVTMQCEPLSNKLAWQPPLP